MHGSEDSIYPTYLLPPPPYSCVAYCSTSVKIRRRESESYEIENPPAISTSEDRTALLLYVLVSTPLRLRISPSLLLKIRSSPFLEASQSGLKHMPDATKTVLPPKKTRPVMASLGYKDSIGLTSTSAVDIVGCAPFLQ